MIIDEEGFLRHHGVKGMKWGVTNTFSDKTWRSRKQDPVEVAANGKNRSKMLLASVGHVTVGTPMTYSPGPVVTTFKNRPHHILKKIHVGKVTTDRVLESTYVSSRLVKHISKMRKRQTKHS